MGLKSAKEFQRKYGVKKLNSKVLQSIIEAQGYTFIEFNGIADSKEVQTLIDILDIKRNIESSKCFVYQDERYRLVFIHEDLNEEERKIVLAHEEGHIWNQHFAGPASFYDDVTQEFEANEFAHYILKESGNHRKKCCLAIGAFLFVFLVVAGLFVKRYEKITYTENLYVTEGGTKYHRKECVYIKDRNDVRRLTLEEFEAGLYEPCDVCFPDDQ